MEGKMDNNYNSGNMYSGDNQGGYNQGGYNQGGYNQGGYNQGGYNMGQYSGNMNNMMPSSGGGVRCPRCGSNSLQAISDTHGDGVKLWKICLCGFLGLCGAGKTKTEHYWVCNNCGNKFKM